MRELKKEKMVSMDVGLQTGTETEAGSVTGEDSGPGVVQTGIGSGDSGELESVVGPAGGWGGGGGGGGGREGSGGGGGISWYM